MDNCEECKFKAMSKAEIDEYLGSVVERSIDRAMLKYGFGGDDAKKDWKAIRDLLNDWRSLKKSTREATVQGLKSLRDLIWVSIKRMASFLLLAYVFYRLELVSTLKDGVQALLSGNLK